MVTIYSFRGALSFLQDVFLGGSICIQRWGLLLMLLVTCFFFPRTCIFLVSFSLWEGGGLSNIQLPILPFLSPPQFPFLSPTLVPLRADPCPKLGQCNQSLNLEQARQRWAVGRAASLRLWGHVGVPWPWCSAAQPPACQCPVSQFPVCSVSLAPTPLSCWVAFCCWQPKALTHSYLSGRAE